MVKKIIKFFDLIIYSIVAAFFLLTIGMMLVFAKLTRRSHEAARKITQLYISIIDFRDSVLSSYREDILLDGFVSKVFAFHLDFDEKRDDAANITDNIYMRTMNVRPNNIFTKIGLRKSVAAFVVIKAFFIMFQTAISKGVNIIRAHDPHMLGFNAYVLSRIMNIPFIVQICSNYAVKDRAAKGLTFRPFIFQPIERAFERAIMHSSDMVITDREHYRSYGIIPKDVRYGNIGLFVDKAHYSPANSRKSIRHILGIPEKKKMLLYVGRLSEVKYPMDLIKMSRQVLNRRADVVLVIAGEGSLKGPMERLACEYKIRDNIIFLAKLAHEDTPHLYHSADLACFTSAGFTMIEAALAQKCIVAYDFEWHSEFIGRNERGMLVPFGDYNKFAETVLGLLEDPATCARLGQEARSYALKAYSREESIAKEVKFYKDIFRRRGMALEKDV